MSDRPTPQQIANEFHYDSPLAFLHHLAEHGYIIAHPDDVPHATHASAAYSEGWTDCRNHIIATEVDR